MYLSRKSWTAALILSGSITLLALYARREQRGRPQALQQARLEQLEHVGNVYLIVRDRRPVGTSNLAITRQGDSITVVEETQLRLPAPDGTFQAAAQYTRVVLDRDLRISQFAIRLVSGGDRVRQQRTVVEGLRPSRADDSLSITLRTGDGEHRHRIAAGPDVTIGSSVWVKLVLSGTLTPGARLGFREFDPTSLRTRPMAIDVDRAPRAKAVASATSPGERRYTVRQTIGGLRYTLEVGADGLPITAKLPFGLRIEPGRVDEILALRRAWAEADRRGEQTAAAAAPTGTTVLAASAIQAGRRIANARALRELVVAVRTPSLPPGAAGGTQEVIADQVRIRSVPFPALGRAGYRLDRDAAAMFAQTPELRVALATEPFIEVTHPAIAETGRRLAGTSTDPVLVTRRITDFVNRHLAKRYTISIPSAVETLRSAQGDCKHHTVLSVALLRAAGVPARPVAGLVYLGDAFYFHAWTEVWLGGQWVPIDATFGQVPADAARIRFFIGLDEYSDALGLSASLHLAVVNAE